MASLPLALTQSSLVSCWSNLPLDLMQMVFERLSFADFERARCVCSSWQSGSKKSQPNNQIPWMIIFPLDKNYALLLNPQDKEKLYKTQDLSNDFAKSYCMATYNSWLLMRPKDRLDEFKIHILHLMTRERIELPLMEAEFWSPSWMLWVDEKTKDYKVIGMSHDREKVVSLKKRDNSWKNIFHLPLRSLYEIVYKDHKLYCLSCSEFKVFDFSGDIPLQIFNIKNIYLWTTLWIDRRVRFSVFKRECVVITIGGDVLMVKGLCKEGTWEFKISKLDSPKNDELEEVLSLGDESIILDLGITVAAKDLEGIISNSIYFKYHEYTEDEFDETHIFIYNLDTKKIERPHQFVSSSIQFSNARWFLPNFKRK